MSQSFSSDTPIDGRKARGEMNRRKLVAAMIALVKENSVAPTAEQVSARAAVSLRTVFRHFDNMESLYREISVEVIKLVTPEMVKPFKATDWRERLDELIERRTKLFEIILPFRIATEALWQSSPILKSNHEMLELLQSSLLRQLLPEALQQDIVLFASLSMVLSISSWQQLRLEQKLDMATARRVMTSLVHRLVADQP